MTKVSPQKNSLSKLALFCFLLLLTTSCQRRLTTAIPLVKDFYDNPQNWAFLDSSIPLFASDYDVFFVYPTQLPKMFGKYYNWLSNSQGREIHSYISSHTQRQFGPRVRIFSPFIPQIDYEQYSQLLYANKDIMSDFYFTASPMNVAIRYTAMALENYMTNYHNSKRPFFLVGYEQGAVILYEALRQSPKITAQKGMLAAYFFGIPGITSERIKKDFKKNHLVPAKGRLDLGVVVIINSRMPNTPIEETYSTPGGYVINPLNWCTDETIGENAQHEGAVFYKRHERFFKDRFEEIPHFCGAVIDPDNALINILLEKPQSAKEQEERDILFRELILNEKSLYSNAWGIFAKNIASNAYERTQKYLFIMNVLKSSDVQED